MRVIGSLVLAVCTLVTPAAADEHEVPTAFLMDGETTIQEPLLLRSTWTTCTDDGVCLMQHREGYGPLPTAVGVPMLEERAVRFGTAQKPVDIWVAACLVTPAQDRRVCHSAVPELRQSEDGWDAVFRIAAVCGEHEVFVYAEWRDELHPSAERSALWGFHIQVIGPSAAPSC